MVSAHTGEGSDGASGSLSPPPLVSLTASRERERRREMRLGFA
jgi:hypothetical protein